MRYFVDVLPTCEGGPLYTITTTSNSVEHATEFADGRVHATFTQTGKAVLVPLNPSLPSYTGHFTVWGGFNQNGTTVNGTYTFNVSLVGSDGSKVTNHMVEHFSERARMGPALDLFRADLISAKHEIDGLRASLAEHGFPLAPVRALELLVWMELSPPGTTARSARPPQARATTAALRLALLMRTFGQPDPERPRREARPHAAC